MCSLQPGSSGLPNLLTFISESCSGNGECIPTNLSANDSTVRGLPSSVCQCEPGWTGRSAWLPTDGRDCHIHLETIRVLWCLNLINGLTWLAFCLPYLQRQVTRFRKTRSSHRTLYGKEYSIWKDRSLLTAICYVCICIPLLLMFATQRIAEPDNRIGLNIVHSVLWFVGRTSSYVASNIFQISVLALVLQGQRDVGTEVKLWRHIYMSHAMTAFSALAGAAVFVLLIGSPQEPDWIPQSENRSAVAVYTDEQVLLAQQSWIAFNVLTSVVMVFAMYRSCSVRYRVVVVIDDIMGLTTLTSQRQTRTVETDSTGDLRRSLDEPEPAQDQTSAVGEDSESTSTHGSSGSRNTSPVASESFVSSSQRPALVRRRNQLVRSQRIFQLMCILELVLHVLFGAIPLLWSKFDYVMPVTWMMVPVSAFMALRSSTERGPSIKRNNGNLLRRVVTAKKLEVVARKEPNGNDEATKVKRTNGTGQEGEQTVDSSDASWRTWVDMEADGIVTIEDLHPGVLAIGGGLGGSRWAMKGGVIEEEEEEEEDDEDNFEFESYLKRPNSLSL